ncbi:class I SAM-dependent methyltransferase [Rhodospirillum sp. A1_3_36]|uniref:class I SAM-dependent methyltransferase n=1 Tax=Rhodospirillum sp. A1_3_36 TaxID=3391666 RepID=UPI0039A41814
MSGFDGTWLALREPVDHAAREMALVEALAQALAPIDAPSLVDIGCGTGSTWRYLSSQLPERTQWLLVDHDPLLLTDARHRIGADHPVRFQVHDLTDVAELPLEGVSVVTASALFDLCSRAFCETLIDRLTRTGCGLYAALNYDGTMTWSRPHPLDDAVVAAFNQHQRGDKGFGPALGPDATDCLTDLLTNRGFHVLTGDSPWQMDHGHAALQSAFLKGFRQPLLDIGDLSDGEIEAWLSFRLATIEAPENLCRVGHRDLLALPPKDWV